MKGSIYLLTALLSVAVEATAANSIAAVSVNQCNKLTGTSSPFILVLKTGQPVIESVAICATKARLPGAFFSGTGQVQKLTLSYYNATTRRYQYKNYGEIYELVSLDGTISLLEGSLPDGKREPYAHAVISDEQYHVSGGHLNEAFAAATVEITIVPLKNRLIKKTDKVTGLNLLITD